MQCHCNGIAVSKGVRYSCNIVPNNCDGWGANSQQSDCHFFPFAVSSTTIVICDDTKDKIWTPRQLPTQLNANKQELNHPRDIQLVVRFLHAKLAPHASHDERAASLAPRITVSPMP